MSETEQEDLPPPSDAELEAQEKEMKKLLASVPPTPALLPAVQKKIRRRSKGKFYSDGWSVESGRINYVIIAALMLFVLAIAYFALGPTGISK
jgi:hypothetical protein